jgi:hypothetical protein
MVVPSTFDCLTPLDKMALMSANSVRNASKSKLVMFQLYEQQMLPAKWRQFRRARNYS